MDRSLILELIHRTKDVLNTIRKLTELSQDKFAEKEFRDFFYKAINRDIEGHHLLLNSFLGYIESTTPVPKQGTVVKLVEGLLKRHRVVLGEKKIAVAKGFEDNLPETIVPDEQLEFILDSLFQCAVLSMSPGGSIGFQARSTISPAERNDVNSSFQQDGKFIEIVMTFPGSDKPMAAADEKGRAPAGEEVLTNLVYQLVEEIVRMNRGTIHIEADKRESRRSVVLRFPAERRKVIHYGVTPK